MSIKNHIICLFLLVFLLGQYACKKDLPGPPETISALDQQLLDVLNTASSGIGSSHFSQPDSDDFEQIPQDPNNPISPQKVTLGKLLFHEPGMAVIPRRPYGLLEYSCASCHHAKAGFQAGRRQGIGEGGQGFGTNGETRVLNSSYPTAFIDVQPIKSPSILNVAYQKNMLYDGRLGATGLNAGTESFWTAYTDKQVNFLGYEGVETQAIAGHAAHQLDVKEELFDNTDYKVLFDNAFPDVPTEERYTDTVAGLAIAAWERTVFANKSPFQLWLHEDYAAMNEQEKKGAVLFFDKANCVACHTGPALNSMAFYGYGMDNLNGAGIHGSEPDNSPTNRGRGGFNSNQADFHKFKVPQLYNMADSPFLGHGSSFTSIEEVVRYKNEGLAQNESVPTSQLAEEFQPLGLNEEEIVQLTAFLETGLRDPDLSRYVPTELPTGLCFPNNDPQSRIDLGCD